MWKTGLLLLTLAITGFSNSFDSTYNDIQAALRIDDEKLSDSVLLASFGLKEPTPHQKIELNLPEEPFKWKETFLVSSVFLTWISMGINEGQKWKQESTGNIDFIWKDDYHMYRGIHNVGCLTTPLIALSMDKNRSSVKWIVGSNLIGWGLYEMALDYTKSRSVVSDKPKFKILNLGFNRPNALACFGLSVLGTVGLEYTF